MPWWLWVLTGIGFVCAFAALPVFLGWVGKE